MRTARGELSAAIFDRGFSNFDCWPGTDMILMTLFVVVVRGRGKPLCDDKSCLVSVRRHHYAVGKK